MLKLLRFIAIIAVAIVALAAAAFGSMAAITAGQAAAARTAQECTTTNATPAPTITIAGQPVAADGTLTTVQVAALAKQAGFTGDDLATSAAIAMATSQGNPRTKTDNNGKQYLGLWGIPSDTPKLAANQAESYWSNPSSNATLAYDQYTSDGNKFDSWSAYKDNSYRLYLVLAKPATETLAGIDAAPTGTINLADASGLTPTQQNTAKEIAQVAINRGLGRHAIVLALQAALQESGLTEADHGDSANSTSLGPFQIIRSTAPDIDRQDATASAGWWFDQLVKIPEWASLPNATVIETIEQSGVPLYYIPHEAEAERITDEMLAGAQLPDSPGNYVTSTPNTPTAENCPTPTTDDSQFDGGNIISDLEFTSDGMTADEIDSFLADKSAACTSANCLRQMKLTSPTEPATMECSEYTGGTNETFGQMMDRMAAACHINPKVVLVSIEKESGGISKINPAAGWDAAMLGADCPDDANGNAACTGEHAGAASQTWAFIHQMARFMAYPDKFTRYHIGDGNLVYWSPDESCGQQTVNIRNQATVALITYTPYLPNQESLDAYPGAVTSASANCASYGNRNFYMVYRKWFGSTGGGKPANTTTGSVNAVAANGPTIQIPDNDYVQGAAKGQTINTPNANVAKGIGAGFGALGLPYVWGGGGDGAGPNNGCARGGGDYNSCGSEIGFDCSGLTAYVLVQGGFASPGGDSYSQAKASAAVSWDQGQPGDIIHFPGHVAIYLGQISGQPYILEASWVGTPIHIVPLTRSDHDDVMYRYWN